MQMATVVPMASPKSAGGHRGSGTGCTISSPVMTGTACTTSRATQKIAKPAERPMLKPPGSDNAINAPSPASPVPMV